MKKNIEAGCTTKMRLAHRIQNRNRLQGIDIHHRQPDPNKYCSINFNYFNRFLYIEKT